MKHEFEASVLCNESEFPTYPRPHINSTKNARNQINWSFLEPNSSNHLNHASCNNLDTRQSLTLDLIPEDDPRASRSTSSQSTTTKVTKMSSNTHSNQANASTASGCGSSGNNNSSRNVGNSTVIGPGTSNTAPNSGFHIGLYGWRKKCLYILILGLMLLIIVNLTLTLWILKVMEFSSDGMGQLKVVPGGLKLSGQALVLDLLRASNIRSRFGQPITLESSMNFSINTRDWEGRIDNHLFLGHDKLEVMAHSFNIVDTHGNKVFSADKNEVAIGANSLRVEGEGGVIFRESVQTPIIRAEPGHELKLEAPTRSLQLNAGQDIFIKSGAGNIDASCLKDVRLHSEAGSIRLDSGSVLMPNLKTAPPPVPGTSSQSHDHQHKVYQLCACSNGKLFLASAHSICAGDESTICR